MVLDQVVFLTRRHVLATSVIGQQRIGMIMEEILQSSQQFLLNVTVSEYTMHGTNLTVTRSWPQSATDDGRPVFAWSAIMNSLCKFCGTLNLPFIRFVLI